MNKKVVLLGGGRGLSVLIRGLKYFPVDLTAVVAVSDDGSSAGRLREEFNIPAVGDIRGVIAAMAESEEVVGELLQYRFNTTSDLDGHTVGNLMLAAMTQIKGSLSAAIEALSVIFKIKGSVLPFTEEVVNLVAKMSDGTTVVGEHNITEARKKIIEIDYAEKVTVNPRVISTILEADLIIFGIGSLYTSLVPNLLSQDMRDALKNSKAKKMFICNAMTQSGETDGYKVSDCIKVVNKYMGDSILDVVIASNTKIPDKVIEKYKNVELKSTILLDKMEIDDSQINDLNVKFIQDDILKISKEGYVEHDSLKVAMLVMKYLLDMK